MINLSFSTNIILGIIWILGSFLIQFIVIIEPRIADDKDGLIVGSLFLSGFILIIHGWRLDPILMFVQELLTVLVGAILYEMIRNRYITLLLYAKLNEEDSNFLNSKEKKIK